MPTTKQRRQSARRRLQRQLDRRRAAARRRRQRNSIIAVVVGVLVVVGGVAFSVTKFGGSATTSAAATPTPSPSAASLPTRTPPAKPKRNPKKTSGPCKYAETAATLSSAYTFDEGLPSDPKTTPNKDQVKVSMATGVGSIGVSLDEKKAPCAVQSFLYLMNKGFYNHTVCHRLTTSGIFVLQCGDPTGTGQGGPTYQFKDENLSQASYAKGTVAMANSGPNTNGSQFFLIYKDSTSLPKKYTVIGTMDTASVGVVQKVANAGEDDSNGPGDGHPKTDVIIDTMSLA
ncbi:MAG TPA: peptidylprolyl isomerase [Mycobacteriales bacterium]|nr:peptidylprolyl isomerase [Mycobacteriales bacterium]